MLIWITSRWFLSRIKIGQERNFPAKETDYATGWSVKKKQNTGYSRVISHQFDVGNRQLFLFILSKREWKFHLKTSLFFHKVSQTLSGVIPFTFCSLAQHFWKRNTWMRSFENTKILIQKDQYPQMKVDQSSFELGNLIWKNIQYSEVSKVTATKKHLSWIKKLICFLLQKKYVFQVFPTLSQFPKVDFAQFGEFCQKCVSWNVAH